MSGKWKQYPAYTAWGEPSSSGHPQHWRRSRLRFATRLNPSKTELRNYPATTMVSFLPMDRIGEDGALDLTESRQLHQVAQGFTFFRDGDVLLAKITPCFENGKGGVCRGLLGGVGFGTTEVHVIRPERGVHTDFLFYLTKGAAFRSHGAAAMTGAAGQQRVPESFIRDFLIGLPPEPEQHTIAAFLDRETAKIDALVAKKERLIELLQEKRTALISHAVTRGLNPNAPLRDSGIPWIGRIPEHWAMIKIGHFATVGNGSTPTRDDQRYWAGGTFPWLNSSVVNEEDVRSAPDFVTQTALHECHLPIVPAGSVLVAITGEGRTRGMAATLHFEATINQHIAYITPRSTRASGAFLRHAMSARYEILRLLSEGAGSTKGALTCEQLKHFKIPLPPLHDQKPIVQFIRAGTAKLDALIVNVRTAIERLQEYRTALISAAVTGQIDVREEARP